MRTLFLSCLATLTGCGAAIDCSTSVPADAIVITTAEDLVDPDGVALVCDGGNLNATGANTEVYVMSGGNANVSGANATGYVQDGAIANVSGAEASFFVQLGAVFNGTGAGLDTTECATMDLDLSATDGCP